MGGRTTPTDPGGAAMAEYIGIDLHKQTSYVTKMDAQGKILEQRNLRNDPETLRGYFAQQPADTRFAVEATGNWMYLYELIEERDPDLVLAHPLKTKAIASARIKTDKIDSTILAHLLRTDLLPAAYSYSPSSWQKECCLNPNPGNPRVHQQYF